MPPTPPRDTTRADRLTTHDPDPTLDDPIIDDPTVHDASPTPLDTLADTILNNPEAAAPYLEAASRAEALERETAELRRLLNQQSLELAAARRASQIQLLKDRCIRDTVSSSDNSIHPDELDLIVGTSPAQLLSNLRSLLGTSDQPFAGGSLALIPVRLWPMAIQPSPNGENGHRGKPTFQLGDRTLPNLLCGATSINQSYASHRVYNPLTGKAEDISLTAFASVSVNTVSSLPEIQDRLSRTSSRSKFRDTGDAGIRAESPTDSGTGTFIPSLTPTQRESSPTSNP